MQSCILIYVNQSQLIINDEKGLNILDNCCCKALKLIMHPHHPSQVISFVRYERVASHAAFDLIKNCCKFASTSNSPKCGVIAKSKRPCHEKNDMAQSDKIFVFLTFWQNRDDSHFLKIATKITSNRKKSHKKITKKIVVISRDLTQF